MSDSTTETWTYIGRRLTTSGKVARVFLDPHDNELAFSKVKAVSLGGRYEVDVTRTDQGVTLHGSPRWTEDTDDPRRGSWAASDRAAVTADELRRAEARAARDDGFGDLTLREAAHKMERLPYTQQTAMIAQVIRYLNRGTTA